MSEGSSLATLAHELRQPLNIIRLACANLRGRLLPVLDQEEGAYIESKLGRIEQQVTRMTELLATEESPTSD